MNKYLSMTLVSALAFHVSAELAPETGLSGEIAINTIFASSQSSFDTGGDERITSLETKSSRQSNFAVGPLGNLAYTFGDKRQQQVYLGTSRDDIAVGTLALQLGYQYEMETGTVVDVAFLPTVMSGKTWANPYQLKSQRQETDESGNAYRLTFNSIQGSPWTIDVAYATKEIDNDQFPSPELARDGKSYYLKGQYRYSLSPTSLLQPSITYINHQADGDANTHHSYAADLSYFTFINRHKLALTAGYTKRDYQGGNSLFNHTVRNDDELSLFFAYEYSQFMDWDDWSLIALAGYNQSSSNLSFYDESSLFTALGLNYQF
ncbi:MULTISPECIES: DUF2860 domain-containing protein [Vibrio]|uniref:Periplasmic protein n=1 Tax=Vibrio ordalii FS-238 TaxID=617133 RepID=A0A853R9L3_9VIBR|nr:MULTISPECIES: DUF2860 domain-containing protein [Vibrio]MDQ2193411.1 DUF2860 domain-containing protein [Vibrio sp. A14(2019)]MDQ2198085.1 DUF2860 domain-containing protein [Vibrio sp. 2017_1457_11]NNN77253.1 DUF2860 domain-containing protein [Vibrio sp. B7]NNN94070.1 DUF2860 domain-containing protein [Vibrio sp. B8-1]NNO09122.1 DUF2860 domain-containing protein [Vibrio sp. B4-12]